MSNIHAYVFTFSFSLLVACFSAAAVSAVVLYLSIRKINTAFSHPYLEHRTFEQYPFSLQAGMTLDYFLRISFPKSKWFLAGHANKLLKNVDPRDLPLSVKWPLVGFWGGCMMGILAMACVWITMLLAR